MKPFLWVPLVSAVVLASSIGALRGEDKKKDDGATSLAGDVEIDKFNQNVKDKKHGDGKPVRGGSIKIGFPEDPKSIQPMIDNDQPTRIVQEYLFDSLVDRDRETFEWLPLLARYWKTRDQLFLKDGRILEGRAVSEDADKIVFAEGASRWTIVRTDADVDEAAGKVVWKKDAPGGPIAGTPLEGTIGTWPGGRYTWIVEEKPAKTIEVKKADVKPVEEDVEGRKSTVFGLLRDVVWDVHVRKGVNWQDGQPLTVDDVLFSYETVMNPNVLAAPVRAYFTDVRPLTKVGDDGLRFEFKRQYFYSLGTIGLVYVIAKHRFEPEKYKGDAKGFGEAFNKHPDHWQPVGFGPYRFSKWERGKFVEIVRNDDWYAAKQGLPWIDPQMPYLDKITWVIIGNKNARLKELVKGDLDCDFDIEQDDFTGEDANTPEFKKSFVRANFLSPSYTYIGWNLRRPDGDTRPIIFTDKRVRLAMAMLIDRQKILDSVHAGLGELCAGPLYKNGPNADRSLEPIEYNPKKAQTLLDQAGWIDHDGDGIRDKDGVKFEFNLSIHTARAYHLKVAEIVKQYLEKAGIRVNIDRQTFNAFLEKVNARKFDAVRFAWGDPDCVDHDPYQIWHSSQWADAGSNHTGYSNPEVDELLEKNRRELNFKKRVRMMKRFNQIVYDDQPYTFLFWLYELYLYKNKFRNVKFTVLGNTPYRLDQWFIPKELQDK